jgi:hypothetical protein
MTRAAGRRKSRAADRGRLGLLLLVLAVAGIAVPTAAAAPPAQVQYALGAPDSGGDQARGGAPTGDAGGGDERPVTVILGSLDNEEVILLLSLILILTAIAAVFALRRGRLGHPRRTAVLGLAALTLTAILAISLPAGGAGKRPPRVPGLWYGMSTQSLVSQADHNRMKQNGVDSVRVGIPWNAIEQSPGNYNFDVTDPYVERVARARMEIFPFMGATPEFYGEDCSGGDCFRSLPAQNGRQLSAWKNMLRELIRRYGRRGSFWRENPGVPKRPITSVQIWNETNFIFFTAQRSPALYGKLVKASNSALASVDPKVKVILSGLFAHPKPSQGPQAVTFLNRLYNVRGIKAAFDGVSLHPYAKDASDLRPDINSIRRVMRRRGDARTPLYLTELGWGSGRGTAFEKGVAGQVRELTQAYNLLRQMQRSARLVRTFWYAWDDLPNSCNFCDTTGLVTVEGNGKPALNRFRAFAKNRR